MKIRILAFGIARDILGARTLDWEAPEGATLARLKQELMEAYPDLRGLAALQLAVNSSYQSDQFQLSEQDEVAIIPPVSGG